MPPISVLITKTDQFLTKKIKLEGDGYRFTDFRMAKSFDVQTFVIADLTTLSDFLTRLEGESKVCVIRGLLKDGSAGQNVLRRCNGPSASFKANACQWLCIDIDELNLPDAFADINGHENEIVAYAAGGLPEQFQEVDFHWQFSASMGIKPGIRIHLWFWLEEEITDEEAKAWLSSASVKVDLSLYNPVQPHFTATPIFDPPESDPIRLRSGVYEHGGGRTEVPIPEDLDESVKLRQRTLKSSRNLTRDGTQIEPNEIVRNSEGKITDGREKFLYLKSIEACQELTRGKTLSRDIPTVDAIAEVTWKLFENEAVLSDERWSHADALEKAIYRHRDLEEGWKPNSRSETTSLVPDVPPYFETHPLPIEEADTKLNSFLGDFFESVGGGESKKLALRVTMGAGKTTRAIEHLKAKFERDQNLNVEIYLPTHDLIAEVFEQLHDVPPNVDVIHMRGRGIEIEGNALCSRYPYVQSLELAGISVRPNACYRREFEKCVHYDDCAYFQQFKVDTEKAGSIRLFPHAYLSIPKIDTLPEPDLIIIDEAFLPSIHKQLKMNTEEVRSHFRESDHPDLGNWIVSALIDNQPLLTVLRNNGVTSDRLGAMVVRDHRDRQLFNRDGANAARVDGSLERRNAYAEALLSILVEEMGLEGREQISQLRYDPRSHNVIIDQIAMNSFPENSDVLILDATADQLILEKIWPDIRFEKIDFEQRAIVTQVFDRTGSNKSWDENEDRIEDLVTLLEEQILVGDRVLCVSHKVLADRLRGMRLPEEIALAHFGAIRGIDEYKDHDTIFITGRNQPPQAAIDGIGRALWWDDRESLKHDSAALLGAPPDINLPTDLRGYLTSAPDEAAGVRVRSFSDPRIEAIHQQQREAETVQAIARLRLVHASRIKHVYLLGNIPIEMPVNRLVEWNSLMPNEAERELVEKGNIPMTPAGWLRMRPDLIRNRNAAREMMRSCGLNQEGNLLTATPLMLRSNTWVLYFRENRDGKPYGREQKHLFRQIPKPGQNQEEGYTFSVPFGKWYQYLSEGDPDVPGSGWGDIVATKQEFLNLENDLISYN